MGLWARGLGVPGHVQGRNEEYQHLSTLLPPTVLPGVCPVQGDGPPDRDQRSPGTTLSADPACAQTWVSYPLCPGGLLRPRWCPSAGRLQRHPEPESGSGLLRYFLLGYQSFVICICKYFIIYFYIFNLYVESSFTVLSLYGSIFSF